MMTARSSTIVAEPRGDAEVRRSRPMMPYALWSVQATSSSSSSRGTRAKGASLWALSAFGI